MDLTRRPASELFYRPFQRMVHYKELLKSIIVSCQHTVVLNIYHAFFYILGLLDNCDIEGEDFSDIEGLNSLY